MAPERLAVWHRASLAGLLAGLLVFALAPLAGTLLALSGQEAALSARAGTVILILAAGLPAGLIALAAAVHLEGIGRAGLVARWMIAANLANAGLNALLIGGIDPIPALGAAGSATATTLVRIALAVALVASVRRIEGPAAFRRAAIADPQQAAASRRDHVKLSFGAVSTSCGMHALGVWLTVFAGWLGAAPLAAFASCWVLNLPGLLLAAGIGDAISMRAATPGTPAGTARLWRDLARLALVLAPISAVIVLLAGPIATHYTPDVRLSALLAMLLPVTGLVLFLDGMSYGIFRRAPRPKGCGRSDPHPGRLHGSDGPSRRPHRLPPRSGRPRPGPCDHHHQPAPAWPAFCPSRRRLPPTVRFRTPARVTAMTVQPNAAARTTPQGTANDTVEWFGLSHAQRAVWLDMRLIEDKAAYQVGCVVTFESAIDPDLARQAVRMMVGRHEALRLRIDRDEPRQRIEPAGKPPFRVIDLTEETDPEATARAHVEAAHAEGFSLGDAPLFRVDLLKLADSRWHLVLLAHHLIADGVALSIAQAHWLNAYRTLSGEGDDDGSGTEAVMPRSTYRNVVSEDEAYAASPRHAEDLAYWTTRLSPLPSLVLDGVVSGQGASRQADAPVTPLRFGPAEHALLDQQAKALGTTIPRALLALVAIGLARRFRRDDFTLGMALHRREATTRYTIGMLAGILPLRCRIDRSATLKRAVLALAADADADLRHQRLPVDTIGRALATSGAFDDRPERNLFDVAVTIMPAMHRPAVSIGGRTVTSMPIRERERSGLGLYVDEEPGSSGFAIGFGHDPAVLSAADVAHLKAVLADVVQAFLSQPDRRLQDIDGLAPEERAAIAGWSAGRTIHVPALPSRSVRAAGRRHARRPCRPLRQRAPRLCRPRSGRQPGRSPPRRGRHPAR